MFCCSIVFLCFRLINFKISACRWEKHNSRATGKGKQGYYFHRWMKRLPLNLILNNILYLSRLTEIYIYIYIFIYLILRRHNIYNTLISNT